MPVSGNLLGLAIWFFKWPDPVTMLGVGLALIAMDMAFRLRARATAGWLTRKDSSGYLHFLPVWGAGIVVVAANVINRVFGSLGT